MSARSTGSLSPAFDSSMTSLIVTACAGPAATAITAKRIKAVRRNMKTSGLTDGVYSATKAPSGWIRRGWKEPRKRASRVLARGQHEPRRIAETQENLYNYAR